MLPVARQFYVVTVVTDSSWNFLLRIPLSSVGALTIVRYQWLRTASKLMELSRQQPVVPPYPPIALNRNNAAFVLEGHCSGDGE